MIVALVAPQGAPDTAPEDHGTFIVVKFVQLEKAFAPIEFTVPLKVSVVRPVQPRNAYVAMEVTVLGISDIVTLVQFAKARLSTRSKPSGRLASGKLVLLAKAYEFMALILAGRLVRARFVQP